MKTNAAAPMLRHHKNPLNQPVFPKQAAPIAWLVFWMAPKPVCLS